MYVLLRIERLGSIYYSRTLMALTSFTPICSLGRRNQKNRFINECVDYNNFHSMLGNHFKHWYSAKKTTLLDIGLMETFSISNLTDETWYNKIIGVTGGLNTSNLNSYFKVLRLENH